MSTNNATSYPGRDLEAMSFANNYHRWVLSLFKKYLGKSVVEVGAGNGDFSALLMEAGVLDLTVLEPSQEMYPLLKSRFEGNKNVKTLQGRFGVVGKGEGDKFDSIVYVNVLEHIEDDSLELQHVYQSLKKGGHVCIF